MRENRNKWIILLIISSLLFSLFTIYIYSSGKLPSVSARAAVLYEPETKQFLYEKNSTARLPMASTTKIMTALVAIEELPTDRLVTATEDAVGIEGSSIYLSVGESMTVSDLLYALLLQSANDAATLLALETSGSISAFADKMNERARALGLRDTSFKNPHGLDEEGHYTSATDLAIIAAEAMKNPIFKEISSTKRKTVQSSERERLLINHNKLLSSYEGCIGGKTGYTKKSGRSLVSAATRDGLTFICVTINDPNDWKDHKSLFDFGYSTLESRQLALPGEYAYKIPVLDGERDYLFVTNTDAAHVITEVGAKRIEKQIKISRYTAAPVNKNDVLGTVVFKMDGQIIAEIKLIAT